jgi:hypothetical protein
MHFTIVDRTLGVIQLELAEDGRHAAQRQYKPLISPSSTYGTAVQISNLFPRWSMRIAIYTHIPLYSMEPDTSLRCCHSWKRAAISTPLASMTINPKPATCQHQPKAYVLRALKTLCSSKRCTRCSTISTAPEDRNGVISPIFSPVCAAINTAGRTFAIRSVASSITCTTATQTR